MLQGFCSETCMGSCYNTLKCETNAESFSWFLRDLCNLDQQPWMLISASSDGSTSLSWAEMWLDSGLIKRQLWLVAVWNAYWISLWGISQLGGNSRTSYRGLAGTFGVGWLIEGQTCVLWLVKWSAWACIECYMSGRVWMLEFCSWMKIWETWCASTPLCFGNVEKVLWVRSCAHRISVWPSLDT